MNERVEISKKRLLINSLSSAITRVVNAAVLVWVLQYLIKRASPQELSIWYAISFVMFVIPIFTTMFTWALSRYVTEAHAREDDQRVTEITSTMFAALLPVGLGLLILGQVVIYHVDAVIPMKPELVSDARLMFLLLFVQVVVRLVAAPFAVGLFVYQRFVVLNLIELASTLVRIAVLAVLLFTLGPRPVWVVSAQVAAYVFQDVGKVFFSVRDMPTLRFRRRHVCWKTAREVIGFNAWSVANQVAWFIHDSAPPILLSRYGTMLDPPTMMPSAMADLQIRNFVQSTTIPMLPVLTAMHATNQPDRLRNSFLRGCRWSLWLIMYFVISLVVYRDEVMRIYLRESFRTYVDSGIVLGLVLIAYLFYLPRLMLLKVAFARGRVGAVISCNLASQLANLALMSYLVIVSRMGAVGAAISILSIEIVWHVLFWIPLTAWLIEIPPRRFVREGFILGAAPMAACGLFSECVRRFVHPAGILPVGLCVGLGLAVYAVVLFRFCLTNSDRVDVKAVVRRLFPRASAP